MEKGDSNDLYEVGNGQSIKNVDFLSSVGYTKSLPIKEVTGESIRTCADNTKLKALGW
jgi:hypothetical protein